MDDPDEASPWTDEMFERATIHKGTNMEVKSFNNLYELAAFLFGEAPIPIDHNIRSKQMKEFEEGITELAKNIGIDPVDGAIAFFKMGVFLSIQIASKENREAVLKWQHRAVDDYVGYYLANEDAINRFVAVARGNEYRTRSFTEAPNV